MTIGPYLYYLGLKGLLIIALSRAIAMYEDFQKHWIFFSLLYTAGVGALSWVFVLSMNPQIPDEAWQHWLVKTFLVAAIYFKLLSRFDQGIMFWLIFPLGVVGLLWF